MQPVKDGRVDKARQNGTRNGRGGKDGRTAHNETGNGAERAKTRVGSGQRNGRDGNAEQEMPDETGNKTDGTEMSRDGLTTRPENGQTQRKRSASSVQKN